MNEQLSIDAPEHIELTFDLAGVGSRFCAALVDNIILTVIVMLFAAVIYSLDVLEYTSDLLEGEFKNWLLAGLILIVFAILWGYYIVFELMWSGRSPGKRLLKLRVVKTGGYPITLLESAIRNLIRLIDFLPVFYGIGVIIMIVDRKWRRLGDLAAGTFVVKERVDRIPVELGSPIPQKTAFTYADKINIDVITDEELSAIREYISRRSTLTVQRRKQLSRVLATPILRKMGLPETLDHDVFLEEALILKGQVKTNYALDTSSP